LTGQGVSLFFDKESMNSSRNNIMKNILFIFLFIMLYAAPCSLISQSRIFNNRFMISASYNQSWNNDTTAYLEITASYYTRQIVLQKDSTGYHGSVALQIFLRKQTDSLYMGIGNYVIPTVFSDTTKNEFADEVLSKVTYVVGIGSYQVSLVGYDRGMPSHRDSLQYSFVIQKKPDSPVTSDLDLCTNISESSNKDDMFYKNGYRVCSNPSLVFGSNRYPVVFSYIELYHLHVGSTYAITIKILDTKGNIQKSVKRFRNISIANTVDIATVNINTLSSGKYMFQYILSDTSGNEITRSEKYIFIYNNSVQSLSGTAISKKGVELVGLSDQELIDEFHFARYIARPDQIRMFDKLTTLEARREFLARFWADIENGYQGKTDISRQIYLQRVMKANQNYKAFLKKGWKTDRGRIYILYDKPDEIEHFQSSERNKPYEIWHYYQIEGGVQFVFIDLSGVGEYTLVHSTKRGELQDESWERNLHY
jgi:GWxTD domain-containing protein